ncbi:MAG: 50S ribosomal protein L21 [Gammaproteobacteria bacterium]|jgi:large subunit ribosomal protein L21|nr:50S ribosomal protein L21 [Gammaproteobacteria bacterium]HBY00725.1 50S ribosomal protein L21 [Gammaproteobacteria bacterium]|tara:strand:- start:4580 stop:5053 length:474 start_codon:yes stop_codon:yes gene_type:complete
MYAVIESGGKQHRVEEGEILRLEKLDAAAGDKLKFDKILLVGEGESVKIGKPYVKGSQVTAEVVKEGRGGKIKIVKFHRRKHYKRQQGHRQWFTEVKIIGIKAETKAKAKAKTKLEPEGKIAPKAKAESKAKAKPKGKVKPKAKPKAKAQPRVKPEE